MGSRKRKPLSDITDIHNLTPLSVLRNLVASNGISKSPVSILKSTSNSTNHNFCPESSDRSNTSIGSSSVGATFTPKTVHFQQPPTPAISPAYSRRHITGKSNKEREAHAIANLTSSEKKKDKGKAITVPLSSSASERMKHTQNNVYAMALADGGTGIQNAAYDQRQTIEKSRKEKKSDGILYHTAVMERKDKGKAIAMPDNSLLTGKLKEPQHNFCSSSTLFERSSHKGLENLSFSNGSAENVKESNKDMLLSSHSSEKTEKRKANLSSSDRALGKKTEIGKDTAGASCFSLEKINDENEGISRRTRSSLVGGTKDRPKPVNATTFLSDETKGEGKMILKPSNNRGPSASAAVKSRPSRKTNEKNKYVIGVSSCPPATRTNKIQDSWTDLQTKVRKERSCKREKTSELPEEFIKEQKAYFEDIDKFDLEVEEVSQDELD